MSSRNILITGATGTIGKKLVQKLVQKGFTPYSLSTRLTDHSSNVFKWNPSINFFEKLPDVEFQAVINLAGASIADLKWDNEGKDLIRQSRVSSTLCLKHIIEGLSLPPKHIISASAIGYYGLNEDEVKSEESLPGIDFAADVCREWEAAANTLKSAHTKVSIVRIGIVLSNSGGFYQKIKSLAKWKIASPLASGKQPVCWIHIDDLVNIFVDLIEGKIDSGIYNAVSKCDLNKTITHKIARMNGQRLRLPFIPSFLLKILFGEKTEIFTKGPEISSSKLTNTGFQFQFNTLDQALTDLV